MLPETCFKTFYRLDPYFLLIYYIDGQIDSLTLRCTGVIFTIV